MNFSITGGRGFLGRRVAKALLGYPTVQRVLCADVAAAEPAADPRLEHLACDLSTPGAAGRVAEGADVIFHLAAVVSGRAEAQFEEGMRVNVDGTRALLEAARAAGRRPRVVFASSLAVYGPPLPEVVGEDTALSPQSSYGMEKAVAELLVADCSRRGWIDGRVVRLPTICVRPGAPNAAASSFVSGIIREPLAGLRARCPVPREQPLWLSSPRTAVANLLRAAAIPREEIGARPLNLPGVTVRVAEMVEALSRAAGAQTAARIDFGDDAAVRAIVGSWPARFEVSRALGLGFSADSGFGDILDAYLGEAPAAKPMPG
jgi:nucleoside-diphosphate-sugar epimerase